jgi:hypothetical protein
MPITSLIRSTYLLVFRDASVCCQRQMSPADIGTLLHEWLEWHDLLESQGRLRFRCPVEPESQPISRTLGEANRLTAERTEPVVGYLLVDAASLEEAVEIARGCPGLERGFTVEVYRPFERQW